MNLLLNFLLGTMSFGQLYAVSKSMLLQARTALSSRLPFLYLQNLIRCASKVCKGLQTTQVAKYSKHIMNFAHALICCCGVNENINFDELKPALADGMLLRFFAGKHTTLCNTSRILSADAQAKKPVSLHLNKRLTRILTSVRSFKGLASCWSTLHEQLQQQLRKFTQTPTTLESIHIILFLKGFPIIFAKIHFCVCAN